jgi:hypothetical protein
MIDSHVNYQDVIEKGKTASYNVQDSDFNQLLLCTALGSKATFSYSPSVDEILDYKGIKGDRNRKHAQEHLEEKERKEIADILIREEKNVSLQERKVVGDASETGLIKFIEPIMEI